MDNDRELCEYLSSRQFDKVVRRFTELEIDLAAGQIQLNVAELRKFYSVYLVAHLICGDLNGAKYLWKRSPEIAKSLTDNPVYAAIWNIGKFLWKQEFNSAFLALNMTWPNELEDYIGILKDVMMRSQFKMFAAAYSAVSVEKIAHNLAISKEEALHLCAKFGWRVNPTDGIVYPRPLAEANEETATVDKLTQNIRLMEKITSYAAQFEKSNVKVDLSSKGDAKTAYLAAANAKAPLKTGL